MEGAQASGETVIAAVRRNLNIISQQDTQTYHEDNKSAGASISASGGTASYNKSKIDSNYQSVIEQTGIFAGTGGFDIEVGGNTDLKGAVIASEAGEDKNTLSTGTLTFSDIENKAEYEADSQGVSLNTNPDAELNERGFTPDMGVTATGDDSSTTHSAVSAGKIDVRSNPDQDLSKLSRDTENAVNALDQIFDKKTVEEQQELSKMFGEEAYKLVHQISAANHWEEGSPEKIALHAFVGAVMADMGGGNALSGAVGAGVNEAVQQELRERFEGQPDLHQWASLVIGAAAAEVVGGEAQTGGSTAASGTKNNLLFVPAIVALLGEAMPYILVAGTYLVTTPEGKMFVDDTGKVLATWTADGGLLDEYGTHVGNRLEDFVNWAKQSKKSDKAKANDVPSWARGQKPKPGESGNDFAKRLLDEKYGPGNYKTGADSEYNKLRKRGDRGSR